jgi:carboxyl-terminal processing protease
VHEISPSGDFERIAARIKGPEGSKVRLRLRDEGEALRDVVVVRAQIDSGSVFGARFVHEEPRIGYLRISGFVLDTAESFGTEVRKLLARGMKALVLDLRHNSGGILPQAVDVADAFLDSGVVVRVRGRGEEFTETYVATPEATIDASLPVAVLVNVRSASASEVLACALRDHRRAVLVGERTWGKFLVQTVEEVPMELGPVFFKRTSAIYESPSGQNHQRTSRNYDPLAGLEPDLFVPSSAEDRKVLAEIFENEAYADWNPDREPVHTDFEDAALEAAVALLRGDGYYPRIRVEDPAGS